MHAAATPTTRTRAMSFPRKSPLHLSPSLFKVGRQAGEFYFAGHRWSSASRGITRYLCLPSLGPPVRHCIPFPRPIGQSRLRRLRRYWETLAGRTRNRETRQRRGARATSNPLSLGSSDNGQRRPFLAAHVIHKHVVFFSVAPEYRMAVVAAV